jgi:glycosyltransferase involved in cell wall biosynthesis
MADPALRARLGDNARQRYAACFTTETAVAAYQSVYQKLLQT